MTKVDFLDALTYFTRESVEGLLLPTRPQKNGEGGQLRPPDVYRMRLPDHRASESKAPYIIHQVITGKDSQSAGSRPETVAVVRTIFTVYHEDESEGALALLGLMERLRIALLRQGVLVGRYQLDLEIGMEHIIYPDDISPFYAGEMASTWRLPNVERELNLTTPSGRGKP